MSINITFAVSNLCLKELPLDELLMGVALLLLEAPAAQQSSLLSLGKYTLKWMCLLLGKDEMSSPGH